MLARLLILVFALTLCQPLLVPERQTAGQVPLVYTSAARYEPLAWLEGADRFPQGATLWIRANGRAKPLVPNFSATADANVSFDGRSVLFAGKQSARDPWQIWEVELPAGAPRQITHCENDCIKPLYVPDDRVVYAHKTSGHFVLEIAPLQGHEPVLQLTHTPGDSIPSDVLQDGRILFASDYPLDNGTTAELYTVYSDGSGVESYRCDHGRSRHSGRQLSSGDVVFAREGKLYRFTSALAHDIPIAAPAAVYAGDVIESSAGAWVVASHSASARYFGLRTWRPRTATLLPLISDAKQNVVQPVFVTQRTLPNRHPSALHEWSYANVLCLNSYSSRDRIPEGAVASVRLYTHDAQGGTQVQGTAQVEKDGSFYLRIPGNRPLRIELLDSSGKTVKAEAGWFWLRSGEQRICVGCHTGPERAADNAVPMVLQRSIEPADLTTPQKSQASAAGGH